MKKFSRKAHLIHGLITCFTLGVWLPVWFLHYFIFYKVNPLWSVSNNGVDQVKAKKAKSGVIKFAFIGAVFVAFYIMVAATSAKEAKAWKETKIALIEQVGKASASGDQGKVLSLLEPHKSKINGQPSLKAALYDAEQWQTEQQRLAAIDKRNKEKLRLAEQSAKQEAERIILIQEKHAKIDQAAGLDRDLLLIKLDIEEPMNQQYLKQIEGAKSRFVEKEKKEEKRVQLARSEALKEIIEELENKAKSLPSSDIIGNRDAYRELSMRVPENKEYANKVASYQKLYDDTHLVSDTFKSRLKSKYGGVHFKNVDYTPATKNLMIILKPDSDYYLTGMDVDDQGIAWAIHAAKCLDVAYSYSQVEQAHVKVENTYVDSRGNEFNKVVFRYVLSKKEFAKTNWDNLFKEYEIKALDVFKEHGTYKNSK